VLRVECTKCDRKGLYLVRKLIEKYGRNGNMMKCCGFVAGADVAVDDLGS
jgi:hypothetical protein